LFLNVRLLDAGRAPQIIVLGGLSRGITVRFGVITFGLLTRNVSVAILAGAVTLFGMIAFLGAY